MEHIRQAVERAKGIRPAEAHPQEHRETVVQQPAFAAAGPANSAPLWGADVTLSGAHLESKRIISHDVLDPRSKSFDMLRTPTLRSMDMKSWQCLGITSPTAGCGKTMISINLALSIARQHERDVVLVDLDLQRPQVANTLGLKCDKGMVSLLEGRSDLPSSIVRATIGDQSLLVLPCETSTLHSSEWMSSRAMHGILQAIRREFRAYTVIVDLPPMLAADDVISILPQIDCFLLVAAVGISTVSEIKECNKHLESASIVRVVLNKAPDVPNAYYTRYGNALPKAKTVTPATAPSH